MNKLVTILAIATVATLDLLVVVGAGLPGSATGDRLIATAVPIMDLCLLSSSVLLGWELLIRGERLLGTLFMLNLALFAAAAVLRVLGSMPPRWILFAADVYWLNLYLVALSNRWRCRPPDGRAGLEGPACRAG